MDTHFPDHPELVVDSGPFAGAAAAGDAGEARRVPRSAAERPPRRRSRLLGGVAVAAVIAVGASVLLTSPYSPVSPADRARAVASARQFASSLGIHIPAPLAPAAALAWFTHPNPVRPVRARIRPLSRAEAVSTVEALRGDAASAPTVPETGFAAPTSASAPVLAPPSAPARAPMVAAADSAFPPVTGQGAAAGQGAMQLAPVPGPEIAPAPDPLSGAAIRVDPSLQQAVPSGSFDAAAFAAAAAVASAAPPTAAAPASGPAVTPAGPAQAAVAPQAAVPAEVSAAAAADPLAAATRMQSVSLPTRQQTQVLDLVTKMATMVGDMRAANRDLVERLARADAQATERIDDLQRRVALAEANKAVNAAALAGTPSATAAAQPTPVPAASDTTAHPARSAAAAATPAVGSRRYRVQAASDRLAMLASVDAAGNDAAQVQASIGDEVAGCGRVKSILQRGTTWFVQTEHCTIQ